MTDDSKSLDVLGLKPVAESVNTITKGTVEGASAFLSRICLPAAEELGFLLRDKVSNWRARNAAAVLTSAEAKYTASERKQAHAHPRIAYAVVENGSWCEDADIQSMWAGLLVTACNEKGGDQDNLLFVNLLAQLTTSQVRILNFVCQNSKKSKSGNDLLLAEDFIASIDKTFEISGVDEIHRLDLALDHLRNLGLLSDHSGLDFKAVPLMHVDLTPSYVALQLYVRCNGYGGSLLTYFNL